jgi:hypothetical protein
VSTSDQSGLEAIELAVGLALLLDEDEARDDQLALLEAQVAEVHWVEGLLLNDRCQLLDDHLVGDVAVLVSGLLDGHVKNKCLTKLLYLLLALTTRFGLPNWCVRAGEGSAPDSCDASVVLLLSDDDEGGGSGSTRGPTGSLVLPVLTPL